MVEGDEAIGAVFDALSHPARRTMLSRLADGECTASELTALLAMPLAAGTRHVMVLEQAGLVQRAVRGPQHVWRLVSEPLTGARSWLHRHERNPAVSQPVAEGG